jgi:hypothetical protein
MDISNSTISTKPSQPLTTQTPPTSSASMQSILLAPQTTAEATMTMSPYPKKTKATTATTIPAC